MKCEFLGSVHLNQNKELLVSSSNLTYEKWAGRVAFIPEPNVSMYVPLSSAIGDTTSHRLLKLLRSSNKLAVVKEKKDTNMSMIRFMTGITRVKWAYDTQHFLAASELGHIELFKVTPKGMPRPMPQNDADIAAEEEDDAFVFDSVMYAKEHDSLLDCIETRLDGSLALTGADDCKIKIWDLNEQMSTRTLKVHDDAVCSLSLHPTDQNMFISCSRDGRALMWDMRKPKPAFIINHGLSGHPSSSCWGNKSSPNLIGLGSEIGQVGFYDVRSMNQRDKPYLLTRPHSRLVRRIEFSPESNEVASASEDCKTCVLKVTEQSGLTDPIYQFRHSDYVTDLAWTSTREYITCSWDGTLKKHQINESKRTNGHAN